MTREALRDGSVSVDKITAALMSTRGDIFLTAAYLGVTAREVNSYIRASDEVKAFVAAISDVKADPEYDRMTGEQFEIELERMTKAFKIEGLTAIHELATMDHHNNAAMADVKLKAAVHLRGAPEVKVSNGDHSGVMSELNRLYMETAPRIKSMRVAQIEFEG